MNPSLTAFIVSKNVRMLGVSFDPGKREATVYSFKCALADIKIGDTVVVESQSNTGYAVACVVEDNMTVNFNNDITYKWIVGKVDQAYHTTLRAYEERVKRTVQELEAAKMRGQFRAEMESLLGRETVAALALNAEVSTDPVDDAKSKEDMDDYHG